MPTDSKEMYKKTGYKCRVVVLLKPIAFLTFCLLSPSQFRKVSITMREGKKSTRMCVARLEFTISVLAVLSSSFIVKSELRSPLFTVHKTKHMAQLGKVARVVAL